LLRVLAGDARLLLPVIVLGEFRFGIAQSRHRHEYEEWLESDLHRFVILEIEEQTKHHYADIRVQLKRRGTPVPANDVWIAAIALQHRLEIVSRDAHFDAIHDIQRVAW
jgi:tRNA(fMet)-specific endonuclease VapC